MTSQTGKQIITIYLLPNVSRSKGNQTIKFGQSMENNLWIIFLEKSNKKCSGKDSPRPFYENSKYDMSFRDMELVLLPHFLHDFCRKIFLTCYFF